MSTPPPLPPPPGYDSWLDLAIDHEQLHSVRIPARAELEQLRQTIKHNASDWAEDHTHAQEACKRFLPADKVDGDSYGVPGIQDLVDMLAVELAALRELTRWRDASKERPTEEGEWYLCAHLEADPRNNRHDIFFFGFNGKGWLIPEPNTLSPAGRFIVTHWMPIPVPPKEPCSSHPPDHTS